MADTMNSQNIDLSSWGTLYIEIQVYLVLAVKQLGREADHPPPVSAKVKKTWIYTSIPSYAFTA
jgi:hypothetical protein